MSITILIILCLSACRTSKLTNLKLNRTATFEQSDLQIREQENKVYSTGRSVTDSTRQFYRVTISPVDSFRFSLQNGFIGKATKVELVGSAEQIRRIIDSSAFQVSADKETDVSVSRKVRMNQQDVSRVFSPAGNLFAIMKYYILLCNTKFFCMKQNRLTRVR